MLDHISYPSTDMCSKKYCYTMLTLKKWHFDLNHLYNKTSNLFSNFPLQVWDNADGFSINGIYAYSLPHLRATLKKLKSLKSITKYVFYYLCWPFYSLAPSYLHCMLYYIYNFRMLFNFLLLFTVFITLSRLTSLLFCYARLIARA